MRFIPALITLFLIVPSAFCSRVHEACAHDTLELTMFSGTILRLEKTTLAVYDTGAFKPRAWIDPQFYLRSWSGLLNTGEPRDKYTKPLYQKAARMAKLTRELCRDGYGDAETGMQRAADVLAGLFGGDSLPGTAETASPQPPEAIERKGQEVQKLEDQLIELFGEFQDNCPALMEAATPFSHKALMFHT